MKMYEKKSKPCKYKWKNEPNRKCRQGGSFEGLCIIHFCKMNNIEKDKVWLEKSKGPRWIEDKSKKKTSLDLFRR